MPASSSEARARWKKRKADYRAARKSKLKEHANDDACEDNEDDEDLDLDPPHNHPDAKDDLPNHMVDRASQLMSEKECETLVDGGSRICMFPIVIQRKVSRPHSSIFRIAEAERAARNVDSRGQGQSAVALLENISHGQLQARSAVPRDSPALLGSPLDEAAGGGDGGSYVIKPPGIISGSGVIKRLGSAGRTHVVPMHSDWFSLNSVHRLERQVVPHFFFGKRVEHTPEKYMECRNCIVAKYMENPEKHLSAADCQGLVSDISNEDLIRIVTFLDSWGIINYCAATPIKHDVQKEGTYLYEDSNNELHVPLASLKFTDSLIKFDKARCRLKASDVYPELACQQNEDPDFDSSIREQLSDSHCHCCSRSIPTVYHQSLKEVDVQLCLDCYHEGGFVAGHSSLDFSKENSLNDCGGADGDSWSDHETLLLLEGIQLYNENWNKIAEHVGSKSKAQCIVHFISLPVDVSLLKNIDVPSASDSSKLRTQDHDIAEPNSNGCLPGDDTKSNLPFSDCENPVISLVAFLASALGPRVAAACAHASLASLSKDIDNPEISNGGGISKSSINGPLSQHDHTEGVPLSTEKVTAATNDGLAAAAVKAKLFADHEEREIQRLSANIINHQLKRLELKLKQFAEIETMLMRECEQMEKTRQRLAAERALVMSTQFGSSRGMPQATSPPGITNSFVHNNTFGSSRQVLGHVSGHTNIQQMHSQTLQQQGMMYGVGPRPPLATTHHPLRPTSNAMFASPSNSQQLLGHPMASRPLSGAKSGFG